MPVRKYRPTSPGRRFQSVSTFEEITKATPEKSLLAPLRQTGGRNALGRVTCRHQGGGHKRMYRQIDFRREKIGVPAKVVAVVRSEPPPNACSSTPTGRSATSWRRSVWGSGTS
jgi:large subunit ribosomal protein L2